MKRLSFLGVLLVVGVAGCVSAGDDRSMACFDTGAEVTCVPASQSALFGDPLCRDNDGDTQPPPSCSRHHHRHHHHRFHHKGKHGGGAAGVGGTAGVGGGQPVLCGLPDGDDDGDGVRNLDDCDCLAVDDDGAD